MLALTIVICLAILASLAQVLMKIGIQRLTIADEIHFDWLNLAWAVISNLYVLTGLIIYAFCAVGWLWVLSKAELGRSYLVLSLSFVIVPVLSYFFFSEKFTTHQMIGMLMITIGVILVSFKTEF